MRHIHNRFVAIFSFRLALCCSILAIPFTAVLRFPQSVVAVGELRLISQLLIIAGLVLFFPLLRLASRSSRVLVMVGWGGIALAAHIAILQVSPDLLARAGLLSHPTFYGTPTLKAVSTFIYMLLCYAFLGLLVFGAIFGGTRMGKARRICVGTMSILWICHISFTAYLVHLAGTSARGNPIDPADIETLYEWRAWFGVLLSIPTIGVLGMLWPVGRYLAEVEKGCDNCGYELLDGQDRCPECGQSRTNSPL